VGVDVSLSVCVDDGVFVADWVIEAGVDVTDAVMDNDGVAVAVTVGMQ
jgi:hypothetical protein